MGFDVDFANPIGGLLEKGGEMMGRALGMDAKAGEAFGDLLRLAVDVCTGNWLDIAGEFEDLTENVRANQRPAGYGDQGSYSEWLGQSIVCRDHRNAGIVSHLQYYGGPQGWERLFAPQGGPPPSSNDPEEWRNYLRNCNGAQIARLVENGQMPPEVMEDQTCAQMISRKQQTYNLLVTLIKSIFDAIHETSKGLTQFRV